MNCRSVLLFGLAGLIAGASNLSLAQSPSPHLRAAERLIRANDKDGDGKLSRAEFPKQFQRVFPQVDSNKDGFVTAAEDTAFRERRNRGGSKSRSNRTAGKRGDRNRGLPEGAKVLRDIVYAKVGQRELVLDLYLPSNPRGKLPVVMWIHGGGWRNGDKGSAGAARPMVGRGFAVADVAYRLSGEAIFPAQVEDCKAAVRWVRANATKHGLDGERIGVWGSSAGGHLVAFLGTSGDVKEFETDSHSGVSSRVQAVVDWFGPTDLLSMNKQAIPGAKMDHDAATSPESLLVGGPIQKEPFRSIAIKADPITYVSADDPPFLIQHGDADLLVSFRQSEVLHTALKKAGVDSTLRIVKGGDHGFKQGEPSREKLVEEAFAFFEKHLKRDRAAR